MTNPQDLLYAIIGAGDLTLEKVKGVDRAAARKYFRELVDRGQTVADGVRESRPAKSAAQRTGAVRSRVESASRGVNRVVAGKEPPKRRSTSSKKATRGTKQSPAGKRPAAAS